MDDEFDIESLFGQTFEFFGVNDNCFKLGDQVYEAVEDPSDGYRSYLGCVMRKPEDGLTFFDQPLATVRVVESYIGFELVDEIDEHEWLSVGTADADDYYPCFIFGYWAKPPPEST